MNFTYNFQTKESDFLPWPPANQSNMEADQDTDTFALTCELQRLESLLCERNLIRQNVVPLGGTLSLFAALSAQLQRTDLSIFTWQEVLDGMSRTLQTRRRPHDPEGSGEKEEQRENEDEPQDEWPRLLRLLREGIPMQGQHDLLALISKGLPLPFPLVLYTSNGVERYGDPLLFEGKEGFKLEPLHLCLWNKNRFDSVIENSEVPQQDERIRKLEDDAFRVYQMAQEPELAASLQEQESTTRVAKLLGELVPPQLRIGLYGNTSHGKSFLLNTCFKKRFLPIGEQGEHSFS